MTRMEQSLVELIPEALLAAGAVAGLLLGAWLPRRRQWLVGVLACAVCGAGAVAAAVLATGPPATAFTGSFAADPVTGTARIVILGSTLLVSLLGLGPLHGHPRQSEFFVLLQLAALGALMLAGAQDLLLLAAAYLLASVPSYVLAGFRKDAPGTEAALKYYVVGALLGVLMLAGITVLYAAGRGSAYPLLRTELPEASAGLTAAGTVLLLAGMLFKAAGVPGHYWLPDAVQGSAAPVAAFLTTVPKIGALAALYRLAAVPFSDTSAGWTELVAVVSAASMTLGNLAAFFQRDVRRLLAYSAISQVGYLLMPVAVAGRDSLAQPALLFYLAAYALTNLGAFAVVCALPRIRTLDGYRGLARHRPALAVSLTVCLLGLVGTPPTAVFLGKLEVFGAALDGGLGWLMVLAAVNTLASLFYYLRWIAPAFAIGPSPGNGHGAGAGDGDGNEVPDGAGDPGGPFAPDEWTAPAAAVAVAAAALSLLLGPAAGPVLAVLDGPLAG
ncbi:NADH-quinone oxidoreductase subunit N [Streptomyces sp. S07_1.15]|uniref:NADH-quinone oxidoreductase subunit N n=1 Tax=Streptomyces sp. S07_1.15 TaxID=2873925 RepID=UPI001D14E71C|nr:NADH-quinone oxidoreductase subunit N [Streptomyces sp. S07_1.15]MCC3649961.1 NADH-quinone oxidoreductase subunit N [Streptomyces sp. S07_1.15]